MSDLESLDPYSIYLNGPKAYLKIVNKNVKNRKLIIFRTIIYDGNKKF